MMSFFKCHGLFKPVIIVQKIKDNSHLPWKMLNRFLTHVTFLLPPSIKGLIMSVFFAILCVEAYRNIVICRNECT